MKKSILLSAMLLSTLFITTANAQINVRINIGNQPVWGPVGYDYVDYYYFPDNDIYYNVPQGVFIYFDGRRWCNTYSLPPRYSNFDLYRSYKVVINDRDPFLRNSYYHNQYDSYRGRPQQIIFNSREPKYFVIEKHPEHSRWLQGRRSNDYARNDGYRGNDNRFDGRDNRRFDNDDRRYNNHDRNENGRDRRFERQNGRNQNNRRF